MPLRHAILGILEHQPMHGYSLQRVLAEGVSTFWPVKLPAIHPTLRKLEDEGLVAHQVEPTPDGPVTVHSPLFLKLLFAKGENLRGRVAAIVEQRDARQAQGEVLGSENEPTRHQ